MWQEIGTFQHGEHYSLLIFLSDVEKVLMLKRCQTFLRIGLVTIYRNRTLVL